MGRARVRGHGGRCLRADPRPAEISGVCRRGVRDQPPGPPHRRRGGLRGAFWAVGCRSHGARALPGGAAGGKPGDVAAPDRSGRRAAGRPPASGDVRSCLGGGQRAGARRRGGHGRDVRASACRGRGGRYSPARALRARSSGGHERSPATGDQRRRRGAGPSPWRRRRRPLAAPCGQRVPPAAAGGCCPAARGRAEPRLVARPAGASRHRPGFSRAWACGGRRARAHGPQPAGERGV
jgi:hypothetical protein